MAEPPRTENEEARLLALEGLGVLDTPEERTFDAITRVAAEHYDCSVSLVTFIGEHRQWFKSSYGWDVQETTRDLSFCAYAILGATPMIVHDATQDMRFQQNALVTGAPHIRFYAGVPLATSDGYNLGTLCVLDHETRFDIQPGDLGVLENLAEIIVEKLELRLQNAQTFEESKRFEGLVSASQDALMAFDTEGKITYVNQPSEDLLGLRRTALIGGHMQLLEQRLVSGDGVPLDRFFGPITYVLRQGTALPATTFGLQREDGSLRWLTIRAEPLLDAHGVVSGAALSLRPHRDDNGSLRREQG